MAHAGDGPLERQLYLLEYHRLAGEAEQGAGGTAQPRLMHPMHRCTQFSKISIDTTAGIGKICDPAAVWWEVVSAGSPVFRRASDAG